MTSMTVKSQDAADIQGFYFKLNIFGVDFLPDPRLLTLLMSYDIKQGETNVSTHNTHNTGLRTQHTSCLESHHFLPGLRGRGCLCLDPK